MKNVAFIFSGRGSLVTTVLDAIRDSKTQSRLSLMITNNVEFDEKFTPKGVDLVVLDRNEYVKRNDFEKKIIFELKKRNISLVILGGFKFIFSEKYVDLFGNITINTHPSLLPAFPGDKAQQRALAKGVIYTGATIHFINEHVDDGPIIDQEVVRVEEGMTEYELKEQIIEVEKIMIYRSVKAFLDGR
ncbi:TPA: phosphoribosylglycinamide formyltransferase, partial [Escherichia coli]|nr:phosphoribosylglycinamide formyltransferase [Escherichia coli]